MDLEPNQGARWEQLTSLYHAALARDVSERQAFLMNACAGDEALRCELVSLLAHADADSFLEGSAGADLTTLIRQDLAGFTGRDIGGYRVTGPIGSGGMAVVYKAVDSKFQRPVAIKFLSDALADASSRRRFLREAQTASSLNHPHIVTVHDIGELDGRQYLVTEFVDGGTLRDWSKSEVRTWQQVVDLLIGVADALATAHEAGIVHRDIKPENILVSKSGYAKLADFGLAKLVAPPDLPRNSDAAPASATRRGVVMGTAGYMAPEQAAGAIVDARSDLFSFGVVLHEMVAGRRPFAAATTLAELQRIIHSAPDPLGDDAPAPLRTIVRTALEKRPDDRYQTMRELLVDLRRIAKASTAELSGPIPASRQRPRLAASVSTAAVALMVAALGLWWSGLWRTTGRAAPVPQIRSVAVLPFQNLSADPNQEYFSDGMTEALISNLAQIHALDVTSRTSVMRFKATKQSIPEIGRTLGVDAIVESSVQRVGNRLRIMTQLIRAPTDTLLWAKEFNGSTSDLLDLQSGAARAIAEELRAQITPDEQSRLAKAPRILPEALDAFLLGRYQYWRTDLDGYQQAIQSYQRAIDLQPDYAAAHAALSLALRDLQQAGGPDARDQIRHAAYTALNLDPNLAEAHAAVGAASTDDWEWERAEQAFRKAIELNPDSQDTCHCYSGLLSILGRHAEAIALMQHSAKVNPLLSASYSNLGMRLFDARRYSEAMVALRRALDMEPENFIGHSFLANVYMKIGRPEDAVREFDRPPFRGTSLMAYAHAVAGHRREATELIRRISPVAGPQDFLALALAHAWLGDQDRAFEWLTKAFDARLTHVGWANVSPLYDVFRKDPRFDVLVARLHLPG